MRRTRFAIVLLAFAASLHADISGVGGVAVARPRVALVLSGGAALGIAHAGVIEVIEEAGIPIDMVLGTSMGAIVGGLYAAGYSPAEMQRIVGGLDWTTLFSERRQNPGDRYKILKDSRYPIRLGFDRSGVRFGQGFLEGQNLMTLFTGLTLNVAGTGSFDRLPVPFRAVSADIITGERVVFSDGSLAEAMRASMSIPGVFAPWVHDGHLLVDGGMVDNMPVDLAREMGADIVIAVESRPRGARSQDDLKSGMAVSAQTFHLFIEENMRASRREADLLIRPDLSQFTQTSFSSAAALIEKGREAALAMRPELEALAKRISETRALVTPDTEPNRSARRPPPVLAHLSFVGAGSEDRAAAEVSFAGLQGRHLDRSSMDAAIDRTWDSGRFSLVTVDFSREADTGTADLPEAVDGTVRLVPRVASRNDLMIGGYWRGVFSPIGSSDSRLSPALFLGNVTGKDSALFVNADIVGKSGAAAEWFLPLGPFYFRSGLRWESQYDSWTAGEGVGVRSYFRDAGGKEALGLALGRNGELEGWWSFDAIRASIPDDPSLGLEAEPSLVDSSLGMAGARLEWTAFDRDPFPSRGFSFDLEARKADPLLGGDSTFVAVDFGSAAALPIGPRSSLAFALFAGTDFSGFIPSVGSLPSPYWYVLAHPGLGIFPLLETRSARGLGDHAMAGSIEARHRVGRLNALLGGDIYAMANLSAGAARITGDNGVDFLPLRWSAGVGLGARFVEHLGAEAMAGFILDDDPLAPLRPAFSFRIGTLGQYSEDRR